MTDHLNQTGDGVQSIAWPAALAFAAIAGTLATSCLMPFVALAVAAAATMPLRRAAATIMAGWLANQMLGFGLLGYPFILYTLGWGVALGAAALVAVAIARGIIGDGRALVLLRVAGAFAAAFVIYEILLFAFACMVGGRQTFTVAIISKIAANDAGWCGVLLAFRLLLASAAPGLFGRAPALRVA